MSELSFSTRKAQSLLRRIAAPMVGGMISTLLVIPTIYAWVKGRETDFRSP